MKVQKAERGWQAFYIYLAILEPYKREPARDCFGNVEEPPCTLLIPTAFSLVLMNEDAIKPANYQQHFSVFGSFIHNSVSVMERFNL